MGGAVGRDLRPRPPTSPWRWPGSCPARSGATGAPPGPAHRGRGPLRAGLRPRGHRPGRGPLRRRSPPRSAGRPSRPASVDERGELPARDPVRVRTGPASTRCWAPTSTGTRSSPCSTPSASPRPRAGDDDLDVAIPSWRYDSETEIDVVEEVARHHGYARIPRRELATVAARAASRRSSAAAARCAGCSPAAG